MDILVPDQWLREFLKTPADDKKIAEYLSLCGPTVDKVEKGVYHIEVTTNRVDAACVYGIASEAAAILPRFGIRASLLTPSHKKLDFVNKVDYLEARVDPKLCSRFTAVLIRNVQIGESPTWVKERLSLVGVRPINNVVDISNYVMHEVGQPIHTFDYDKIGQAKMTLRSSQKGETITTLDGKSHTLSGGDIVIEDGNGRLIDLAGIMGADNSAVDEATRNVLLFVQTYNPVNIRQTSMALAQRTEAAVFFEKGLDPENVTLGIARAIGLFIKLTKGKVEEKILDLYPKTYKPKELTTTLSFINKHLGVELKKSEISSYLTPLGFEAAWLEEKLSVKVPSQRADDINIQEDIVEEVARIYGYHNLPSKIMTGAIPNPLATSPFAFERALKEILKAQGGIEVYTSSLVPKENIKEALRIKNPLGAEGEYLRTTPIPSFEEAVLTNAQEEKPFFLFEMANVYIPRKNNLPDEVVILSAIFKNYDYREAKGTLESLLTQINSKCVFIPQDGSGFAANRRLVVRALGNQIGQFGILEKTGCPYFELEVEKLKKSQTSRSYQELPKFPPQIEDITFSLPERTRVGDLMEAIKNTDAHITSVELKDTYKDAYTFEIHYQSQTKTLEDREVEKIRNKILKKVKEKFGATLS